MLGFWALFFVSLSIEPPALLMSAFFVSGDSFLADILGSFGTFLIVLGGHFGERALDGGAVKADDSLAVDFGDRNSGDVRHGRGVDFLIFNSLLVKPFHERMAIHTGFSGVYFNHVLIIAQT